MAASVLNSLLRRAVTADFRCSTVRFKKTSQCFDRHFLCQNKQNFIVLAIIKYLKQQIETDWSNQRDLIKEKIVKGKKYSMMDWNAYFVLEISLYLKVSMEKFRIH